MDDNDGIRLQLPFNEWFPSRPNAKEEVDFVLFGNSPLDFGVPVGGFPSLGILDSTLRLQLPTGGRFAFLILLLFRSCFTGFIAEFDDEFDAIEFCDDAKDDATSLGELDNDSQLFIVVRRADIGELFTERWVDRTIGDFCCCG